MKQIKASADAYMYGSARIRALENQLIGGERLERLLNAGSLNRCVELMREMGVTVIVDEETGALLREETLERRLKQAYTEVLQLSEDAAFLRLWLFPYDCNNIKALIKCRYREISPQGMLFDFGTVPSEQLTEILHRGSENTLPPPFGAAAEEAAHALAATANPQTVDLILDAACWRAMLEEAKKSGVRFAVKLVQQRIDLINLLTCLRRMRMSAGAVREVLPRELLLEGGTLSYEELSALSEEGESHFLKRLEYTPYEKFSNRVNAEGFPVGQMEREAENFFLEAVREARMIPFGAEPILGYLLAVEYEVKNLRILLSGYGIGLSKETVRERMRGSYV